MFSFKLKVQRAFKSILFILHKVLEVCISLKNIPFIDILSKSTTAFCFQEKLTHISNPKFYEYHIFESFQFQI